MNSRKLYEYSPNWLLEIDINDDKFIDEVNFFIDKNLNNFFCSKDGLSTKGKKSQQYWIHQPPKINYLHDENYVFIENHVKEIVYKSMIDADILSKKVKNNKYILTHTNSWVVIGEEGGYHTIHDHGSDPFGLSTVLYTKVPNLDNFSEEQINNNSGNIFFVMNSTFTNNLYEKPSKINIISPLVGKLLIFPSWVLHGTYPQLKGTRQTLNINYTFSENFKNNFFVYTPKPKILI